MNADNVKAAGGVYVFNASPHIIYLNVNNAPPPQVRSIPAASAFNWLPTPSRPPLTLNSIMSPGVFGVGENKVSITPATTNRTLQQVIEVPDGVKPDDALQLYIATSGVDAVFWLLQINGKPARGGKSL